MDSTIKMSATSRFCYYFWQFLYLIPIAITIHYCQITFINQRNFRYKEQPNSDLIEMSDSHCKQLSYEMAYLRKEVNSLREEVEDLYLWKSDLSYNLDFKINAALDSFYSDQIGLFDYASEYAGGSIISTPNTISYPSKYIVRLFNTFDWTVDSEPNIILQYTTLPGKCYAFYGQNGRIRIKLGRPVTITHVTLEHIRIADDVSSAPKDFQVLGLGSSTSRNLGRFVYDLNDTIIQTFRAIHVNQTFRAIELVILSNYGNDEFTCVYRFRVHSVNVIFS